MSETVSVRMLKNQISEVLRRVEGGTSFDVLSNGHPVAELRPYTGALGKRRFIPLAEIKTFTPLDRDLRRDLDALLDNDI
jgi:antitoxin (DNA-binding transcriptional repressor) of toxin-antitoxin stability system